MTTLEGDMGADSTMVNNLVWKVGTTPHTGFMQYMQKLPAAKVAIPVGDPSTDMHSIGLGSLLFTIDPNELKRLGYTSASINDHRTYGRPLVLANAGNLPHGLPDNFGSTAYGNQLSKEEMQQLKLEQVRRYIRFFGVSQGSFTYGSSSTTTADGLPVFVFGGVTVTLFTPGKILRPLALLVVSFVPSEISGRTGTVKYKWTGKEKYPLTLSEMDPLGTVKWTQAACAKLKGKFDAGIQSTRNGTVFKPTPYVLHYTKEDNTVNNPMLEDERNAADLLVGLNAVVIACIDELIKQNKLADTGYKTAKRDLFALGGTTKDAIGALKILEVLTGSDSALANLDNSEGGLKSLTKSAPSLICGGILEIHGKTNHIVGRNMGVNRSGFNKNNGGHYDYDMWIYN